MKLIYFILIIVVLLKIRTIRKERVEKFFISHGYKRKLLDISLFGEAFYGWIRESDGKVVNDLDIRNWSLKRIRKEYE